MSKQIEALKLALEALECTEYPQDHYDAITAIKEVLAQPEQEPVAWIDKMVIDVPNQILYTPPQRTWVGLMDEEIKRIGKLDLDSNYFGLWYDFAKAIEAKLKEKNA